MPSSPQKIIKEVEERPLLPGQPAPIQVEGKTEERPLLQSAENQPPGLFQLRASTYDIIWVVSFRLIAITIIVACLTLGAKKQVFGLKEQNVKVSIVSTVFNLPVDAQLAIFGLVNKLLDYLVEDALFHICGVTLTTWMALTKIGARTIDFQMQDEMTKPWITVMNFVQRFKLLGWGGVGFLGLLRYLASFATAACVLLLGASVNTIGIPKERWTAGKDLWTDRYLINSIEWGGVENIAYNMGFSFEGIQNRSLSIIASQCWLVTSGLWLTANKDGWIKVYEDTNGVWNKGSAQKITGVRVDDRVVSSLSIQGNAVYDMWKSQAANGSLDARNSFGWTGAFNLTLPIGVVSCVENTTDLDQETVGVVSPGVEGTAVMGILFGNSPAKLFPGATCTFTLRQGQYEVHSWIIDESQPDISIDNYGTNRYLNVTFCESQEENRKMLTKVADTFREIIPTMDDLSRPNGFVQHVLSIRDNLLKIGLSSPNSGVGLALVVAGMVQHIFTMAEWELVGIDPGKDLVRSTGVRYQVYGSGPRLAWEWAIATVLAIILLLLIYDLFLTLSQRINVGEWLSLSGMMVAANYADRMPSVNDGFVGAENETIQKTSYFIRKLGLGNPQLTDDPNSGSILSKMTGSTEADIEI